MRPYLIRTEEMIARLLSRLAEREPFVRLRAIPLRRHLRKRSTMRTDRRCRIPKPLPIGAEGRIGRRLQVPSAGSRRANPTMMTPAAGSRGRSSIRPPRDSTPMSSCGMTSWDGSCPVQRRSRSFRMRIADLVMSSRRRPRRRGMSFEPGPLCSMPAVSRRDGSRTA